MVGFKYGSVQDPRVVKIEDTYYMTFAFRRFAWNIYPTGLGLPEASQGQGPVKDDLLWIYYGCCDTAIGLATVPLNDLVDHVLATGRK